MKKQLLIFGSLLTLKVLGQGFPFSSTNWNAPNGGMISSGKTYGFNSTSGFATSSFNTGSQSWSLIDMNGDKLPDLVVTGQLQAGNVTCFSPGAGPYWKVYLNSGTNFAASATNWALPNGGKLSGGVTFGFENVSGTATSSDNTGSQSWSLMDVNGDGKPDLIVTAQLQGGNVTCFSPGSAQYWKVYTNTGSGFSSSEINWSLPNGGKLTGGITYGYNSTFGTGVPSDNTGSQSWSLTDMDGDKKPDLLITAQLQAGNVTCFSPGSNQYWKIFTNNGSGFSGAATNWNLPNGGKLSGGITFGYNSTLGSALTGDNTGSQSWTLFDLSGDGKPELLVTAQLQASQVTCFSPGSSQYWKMFANTGTSFDMSAQNWSLPDGGKLSGGVNYGFDAVSGLANSSQNTGSQTWSVVDINGDGKWELLVTGQLQAGKVTCFSPGSSQYWKIYNQSGNGFSTASSNFTLPDGGKISGSSAYGFDNIFGTAFSFESTGSQSWALNDMNADGALDLIITGQLQAGDVTSFSPSSSQYWKVFFNPVVTGISEYKNDALSFSAYPNPNNGSFVVKGSKNETLKLCNELGQILEWITLDNSNQFTTEIKNLATGIYFIAGLNSVSKIVVLR